MFLSLRFVANKVIQGSLFEPLLTRIVPFADKIIALY